MSNERNSEGGEEELCSGNQSTVICNQLTNRELETAKDGWGRVNVELKGVSPHEGQVSGERGTVFWQTRVQLTNERETTKVGWRKVGRRNCALAIRAQ